MGKTDDRLSPGLGEGKKRRGPHFDRDEALGPVGIDGAFGFPERRVDRPGRTAQHGNRQLGDRGIDLPDEFRVRLGKLARRQVVIAGPLVTERLFDEHELGRIPGLKDLLRGGHADQKLAAAGKKLLRDENGERAAHGASDNAQFVLAVIESIEIGVIAGPLFVRPSLPARLQSSNDIAVGIEHADRGHGVAPEALWRRASRSMLSGRKTDGEV